MFKKYIVTALVIVCSLQPLPAFAYGRSGGHGGGGHGGGGQALAITSLAVSGAALLYSAGMFYRSTPTGYVIVQPPLGAVVPVLPPNYTVVYANGVPYYNYANTYYAPAPNGYVVTAVAPAAPAPITPVVQQAAPPVVAQVPLQQQASKSDAFQVYIPNGNGSYTTVTLRQTNQGFLGPQGEFYTDHPTIEQLRERYSAK